MSNSFPEADEPSLGTVTAVSRALTILDAFTVEDGYLTLAELARRSALHKSTVLRLARTLAEHQYLVRDEAGRWRLGAAAGWLGARYQASFDLAASVDPVLHALSRAASENATFFVKEGDVRVCLYRVEGPHAVRYHIRTGQALPLERGSPGKVILAFTGAPGEEFDAIRRAGHYISIGERDPEVASISAPVYGANWQLLGAISVSGPASRLTRQKLQTLVEPIIAHANRLSIILGGHRKVRAR